MGNFRRVALPLIIALAILLPIAAAGFIGMKSSRAPTGGSAIFAQFGPRSVTPPAVKNHPTEPIQAVGSNDTLWIMQPALADGVNKVFQIWAHAADAKDNGHDRWEVVQDRSNPFALLTGVPGPMVIQVPPFGGELPSSVVVFFKNDDARADNNRRAMGYALAEDFQIPLLPENQQTTAAAGGGANNERLLFALTLGSRLNAVPPAATQSAAVQPDTISATAPTASAPATATATAPATNAATQTATAPADTWNIFQRSGTRWSALPGLGNPGEDSPTLNARIALVLQKDRLWVMWVDPVAKDELRMRSLTWQGGTAWSATLAQKVSEPIGRLQVVTIPQMIVLWPVKQESKDTVALHGVTLSPEGTMDVDAKGKVRMMNLELGDDSKGSLPERDIAAAQLGNSIAVIIKDKADGLHQILFSADGRPSGPAVSVDATPTSTKLSPLQENGRLIIMMVLMALSLWFWRRQPVLIAVPKGVQMAALGQRVAAGLIDAAGPLVIIVVSFHLYDPVRWKAVWPRVAQAYETMAPEQASELMWFILLYAAHVTISEMVSGRSLGKAIFGLKVIGLDGRNARPQAIFLRNLIRIAEWMLPPVMLAPMLTQFRQRIGDIVARTLVVQMNSLPPEADKDDASAKK